MTFQLTPHLQTCSNRVRTLAEQQLEIAPGVPMSIWTDDKNVPGVVLVALAFRDKASCVIAFEAKEYVGLQVLELVDRIGPAATRQAEIDPNRSVH